MHSKQDRETQAKRDKCHPCTGVEGESEFYGGGHGLRTLLESLRSPSWAREQQGAAAETGQNDRHLGQRGGCIKAAWAVHG